MNIEVRKMKLRNCVILSLLAIFSVTAIFFGTVIAQEYSRADPGENLAMTSPAAASASVPGASAILARPPAPSRYCFDCLPTPRLTYTGKEDYTVRGVAYTRFRLSVANRDDYPASLFKPAPDLPPCGLNTNSARTWVNIYNSLDGGYIYGFCALSSPSDLSGLWFAVPQGEAPPKSVYITLNDRSCSIVLKSNSVAIS
jgi:hypothetical protein